VADDTPWDLAILDRLLADMDGVVLCHELKSTRSSSSATVILLTARPEQKDKVMGSTSAADDYITKPFHRRSCWRASARPKRIVDLQKELLETNKAPGQLSITTA